jgi:hypothetical protein
MKPYTTWLAHGDHRDVVARAYQRACCLLVKLHDIAKCFRPDIEDLGLGIQEAATCKQPLLIDDKPRLLIDDRARNVAFTKNGDLDRLHHFGLRIQMVRSPEQMTLETCA